MTACKFCASTACDESLTDNSGTYPCLHRGPHDEHLVRIGENLLAWPNDDPTSGVAVDEANAKLQAVEALVAFYDRHEYATLNVDDLREILDRNRG